MRSCRGVPMPVTRRRCSIAGAALMACLSFAAAFAEGAGVERPRARDIGLVVGVFSPGRLNAITDVDGVKVGHTTVIEGAAVRTGVTAIIPAPGNLYTHPVPAAVHVGNGYGKLTGVTQIRELGEIETPVLLTCTLCVWTAADALKAWAYEQPGMGQHTINPVVGETNDGQVNDMWTAVPIRHEHVFEALESANGGPVTEGSVGAGTGTQAFAWKGGIGTSSRVLPEALGGYTVGVLVQTNFGGILSMNGAPVGRELGKFSFNDVLADGEAGENRRPDGSIMIVIATDAPLYARNLERLGGRAIMGLARTGSFASNGSGDYVIAFSTDPELRMPRESRRAAQGRTLANAAMSPLFAAAAEATEEAIYNALLKATTVDSSRGTLEAIPIEPVVRILENYNALHWDQSLPPHAKPGTP